MHVPITTSDWNRLKEMAQRMVARRKLRASARKRSERRARRLKKLFGESNATRKYFNFKGCS